MCPALEFPCLAQQRRALAEACAAAFAVPLDHVRVVFAPYRVCPLGAHIDHQGGPVLGMTINAGTLLAYAPRATPSIALRSMNFPGDVAFDFDAITPPEPGAWGNYARCATRAMLDAHRLRHGFAGITTGTLPGCGLSSSASVVLAYLHALADVNGLTLAPWDYVHLARRAENTYFGLRNGILDQTSIIFSRRGHVVMIDTRNERATPLPQPAFSQRYRLLIAYSGISRELIATGYNTRVQECRDAAAELGRLSGAAHATVLSDLHDDVFARHGAHLPDTLRKRAQHYFSEVRRVHDGVAAWQAGDVARVGTLMTQSCRSSIELFDAGSPLVRDLQACVCAAHGVCGARFNGGGFGGCVAGIVTRDDAVNAGADVLRSFRALHPDCAGRARVYLADSYDGISWL